MDNTVNQTMVANQVGEHIEYNMLRAFLVKPLEAVMVEKEFETPIAEAPAKKDANGVEAVEYSDTAKEIKTVESDFKKGIVLKIPEEVKNWAKDGEHTSIFCNIKVGDTIVYPARAAKWFDLCKDTQMISTYDIVAVVPAA